jgi:1-acyl-sn-glycerol-3-phosphate acyltransferase
MFVPVVGEAVPKRGNRVSRGLGRAALALFGFRMEGEVPDVPKIVAIVAPHTSNWDFLVGLAGMLALGVDFRWLGKHTIFRFPFGPLFRWLGGIPVDRRIAESVVESVTEQFRTRRQLFLALTPEGTRKAVKRWKSGFYRIALSAGVPILPVSFDHSRRVITLWPTLAPTGDYAADLPALASRFDSRMGKRPAGYVRPSA